MDKAWKAFERRVAAFFKTERNALSGGNSKLTRSDTLHPELFIECKQRKRFAVIRLWDETKRLADAERKLGDGELRSAGASPKDSCGRVPPGRTQLHKENKTPVVCLSERNRPGFWILVHSDDFTKL